jgi:hypothetical protein
VILGSFLGAWALGLAAQVSGGTIAAGKITAPPGRVAELLARLPDGLAPAALGPPWPVWEDRSPSGWGGEPAWRRWVELLRAEAREPLAAPLRRAQLALVARLQGRDGDAWEHLLACGQDPALVAALLPTFVPGAPQGSPGGAALPDGCVLSPALPPSDDPRAGLRILAGTKLTVDDFALGAARCALTVSVDGDGLEVNVRHLSGGPARVRLVPPLPRGVDAGLLLADWEKLPGHVGPVELALDSEANDHSLWLTFHPRKERWPSPLPAVLLRPDPLRAIVLTSPRGDEAYLARFAEALSELFGVSARLEAEGPPVAGTLEPLVLRFSAEPTSERKLAELIGLAEALLLRPGGR